MLNKLGTYNVAIYLRLSKDDGDDVESESITNQRKIIKEYLESQVNAENCYEYVDDGYSGANFDRPAFKRLLKDIDAKKVNMVVTKNLARFGRNYIDSGEYIERQFPDKGIRYIAVLDKIDNFEESVTNDFLPLKSVFNEKFCKDTSISLKKSKRRRMAEGIYACTTPPFGYKKDLNADGKLIIDEVSSKTVRKIFDLKLLGFTHTEIVKYLQEKKYMTPAMYSDNISHKKIPNMDVWKRGTVNKILSNVVYLGHCLRGKTQSISYKCKGSVHIKREDQIITYNTHEAIVTEEEFKKIHNTKKYGSIRGEYDKTYLLKGLLFCGECGKSFFIKKRNKKRDIYCVTNNQSSVLCSNERKVDYLKLEEKVKQDIIKIYNEYFNSTQYADKLYIEFCKNRMNELNQLVEELNQKQAKLNFKISELYSKRLSGQVNEGYEELYRKMVNDRKSIKDEILKNKEFICEEKTKLYNAKNKKDILLKLNLAVNNNLSNEDIKKLITKIEISKKEIIINYIFSEPTKLLF